jgi:Mn-containing catalase
MIVRLDRLIAEIPPPSDPDPNGASLVQELLGAKFGEMSTFMNYTYQSFNFATGRARGRIKRGEHLKLYRWSPDDFHELAAVFNGPHPETGEELEVAEELHPEGALAYDLPPQPAVLAPGPEPGEIEEIAQKLREASGLSKEPSGEVASK